MQHSHCDAGARKREEGRMGTQNIYFKRVLFDVVGVLEIGGFI